MNVLHCPSWLQRVRTVEVALFKLFFMKALFVWLLHLRCELRGQKGPVRQTVVTKTPGLFYLPTFLQRGLHVCVRLIINVNIGAIFRLERINALLTLVCIGTRGRHLLINTIIPVVLFQATLVADHRKTRVLVILVRSAVTKEEALLVSTTASYPVTRPQDLEIKTALPIDNSFRYVSNYIEVWGF